MKFYVLRLVNWLPNAVRQTNQPKHIKPFFCSTLSEFENFLLCERMLVNLTTCQNETSS
jgi:hypothetical protein